jgi:hypothetical protein
MFAFSHKGFWVFTLACQWFDSFANMVWKNERCWMLSFFGFEFILHAKGVGGVATNARNLYFKTCYYCR